MIEIASLVGVSYTGKSELAKGLAARLRNNDIGVDIVTKDEAMQALGRERYGKADKSGGYSITGFLRHGQIPSRDLHSWMNRQIKRSKNFGNVVILEGGTRTRSAQAETLQGIELDDEEFRIFMLRLPFREVMRRARQRRIESGRYDDRLPVAVAKLYGQYKGMRSADSPQPGDPDVMELDARLTTDELVDITVGEILGSA